MTTHTFDLVIRNAHAATASDTFKCDIGIQDGRIAQLGQGIASGAKEIDAQGAWVTPGGIDGHCHLDEPIPPPLRMADNFETGTRSAACGGTTTIIPFAVQRKGQSLREAVGNYHGRAQGLACIDYGFHMIITDPSEQVLQELPGLIDEGYTSFKMYMTYEDMKLNDRQILDLLDIARTKNAMAMVHAENADCIEWLTRRLEQQERTSPRYHAHSRPMLVEREATHRAISLSELAGAPIMIVHVSGKEAMDQIRWARNQGITIYAETCPQYLFLTEQDLGSDDDYAGARCVCSPPPRDKNNQQFVWQGLSDGLFTIFSSDHAPFSYDSPEGKKPGGKEVPFRRIPNGIPGLETRLALLFSHGVLDGRLSINRFVELTSTNPAKAYGLHPKKGTIAVGADADLVIWSEAAQTIQNINLHHAVDYTPYEGIRLRATPGLTLSRGQIVYDHGTYTGAAGQGRFLRRTAPTLQPIYSPGSADQ
ncbi:MAG TPA: dihydropyrimidinase [Advenella sp.]|nr:dihydropyrimidinase [Advenella sp.]